MRQSVWGNSCPKRLYGASFHSSEATGQAALGVAGGGWGWLGVKAAQAAHYRWGEPSLQGAAAQQQPCRQPGHLNRDCDITQLPLSAAYRFECLSIRRDEGKVGGGGRGGE